MHRTSPANAAFRGYVAGGARHTVDQVNDQSLMQESSGGFMANEQRGRIEAPQNYGFTSVVHSKDDSGSAETFVQFLGGNRSLPVCQNMDDRRHRLNKLDEGDSAMFRGKDDYQQFHMSKDGGFWSGPQDKTLRMALVNKTSGQQQQGSQSGQSGQSGGAQVGLRDGSSGGGGSGGGNGSSSQGGQSAKKTGQQALKADNQQAAIFLDMTKDSTRAAGKEVHSMLDDGKVYLHVASDKQVYTGGQKGKDQFALVVTTKGPAKNVWGKIG